MEPLQYNLPGYPEIFVVSNVEEGGKALGMKRAGWGWHTDGEDKSIPNAGLDALCARVTARGRRHAVCGHVLGV